MPLPCARTYGGDSYFLARTLLDRGPAAHREDMMKLFSNVLSKLPAYDSVEDCIRTGRAPLCVTGLSGIHKAHFIHTLSARLGRTALVIVADEASGRKLCDDINTMGGRETALLYPSRDFSFRTVEGASHEFEHARLAVLGRIVSGECRVAVASVEAAAQLTIPKQELVRRSVSFAAGQEIPFEHAVQVLSGAGYVRRPQVDGVCQFAVRGGILDFFPPDSSQPVRAEFWGDEIDTISYFELESQRRTDPVNSIVVTPGAEVLCASTDALVEKIGGLLASVKGKNAAKVKAVLENDRTRLESGEDLGSFDKYISLLYDSEQTIYDYMPDALLFVCETASVKERAKNAEWQLSEDLKELFEEGILFKGLDRFAIDYTDSLRKFEKRGAVYLDSFARSVYDTPVREHQQVTATQISPWGGEFGLLKEDVEALLAQNFCVAVMAGTEKAARMLAADLQKNGVPADFARDARDIILRKVYVLPGALSSGFEYPDARFALISHGRAGLHTQTRKRRRKQGEVIRSLSDLKQGDLVVHISHGIGVFDGIHKLDLHGVIKDYIKIKYAGADVLYVPVTQLDLVSKYIGPRDDSRVRLNKLNSAEWQKTKARVKKAATDMAKELIKLYAERMQVKGYPFSADSEWQHEFEEKFPYQETDDQLRCVAEIKQDMEAPRPMERLLCGDVGFGKTEVALRAAFKCVVEGKQCAILVPTTILAWQHYQTTLARVEGFPVKVELLSRFRTPKQQESIVKKLATGEVDIIIGTHRIVQKDIRFKDLGLVIIDEEQRFGVAHKERFKEMFANVDILTLSATPIPRTLNMAMQGIRDMSVIEEAPMDRHPVQTYVLEHDWSILSDAIRKELRRGGQVYYLHNRVESIDQCAGRIGALVPDARIAVAHGKMGEEELSEVWRKLMEGEIDVLVCTTIIETGVDVSNCNTLIIEDADHMGLSQLYQLRGRVGRSSRRAYAYMTFRRGKVLTDIATKRLSAIREFTKFGSGFGIAMRDLEIRGAGSILGTRQHGHMEAVGYEMYLRLLSEAVSEQRGEKPAGGSSECMVDIRIGAHIPESYIDDLSQRIDIYKHIAAIGSQEDALDVVDELIDRYGEPPAAVKGLIDVALLRGTAARLGISEIVQREDSIVLFPEKLDMDAAGRVAAALGNRVMVNASAKPYISVKIPKNTQPIDTMREALTKMSS